MTLRVLPFAAVFFVLAMGLPVFAARFVAGAATVSAFVFLVFTTAGALLAAAFLVLAAGFLPESSAFDSS